MAAGSEVIERSVELPVTAEEAFAWHDRPGALERLIPPWERVEVLQRSGGIADGGRVTLRVHVGPAAFRWVAYHRDYQPGRRFVDEQVEGPFRRWVHVHDFEPVAPGSSRLTDRIELVLPGGAPGGLAGGAMIRRRV
jgi:ligand-binding SRPBCC domain-containing protein